MKPIEISIPTNIKAQENAEAENLKVYVHQNVYKAVEAYSAYDLSNECGSVLMGDYVENEDGMHIIISDFIEARYTDATASSLTFTHDTWDFIHMRRDRNCPEKRIMGWHHTHPGYDIFLSVYDMFIHQNFFDLPFQVAYVVDPVKDKRGFFRWKDGNIEKLQGFYIYDDEKHPIKLPKKKSANKENTVSIPKAVMVAGAVLLLLTTVVGAFSLGILLGR